MEQLIIAILGAAGALIVFRQFDKGRVSRKQTELDKKVKESDKTQARLEGEQAQEDKETQRKVDEITDEQNNKPTGSNLADWFNRRK